MKLLCINSYGLEHLITNGREYTLEQVYPNGITLQGFAVLFNPNRFRRMTDTGSLARWEDDGGPVKDDEISQSISERKAAPKLEQLIGLRLTAANKVAGMQTLQFGPLNKQNSANGKTREVGSFALHIQCPFCVMYDDNAADMTVVELILTQATVESITTVSNNNQTKIKILFDYGFYILVSPDMTSDEEQWRLFVPGGSGEHLVFPQETMSLHQALSVFADMPAEKRRDIVQAFSKVEEVCGSSDLHCTELVCNAKCPTLTDLLGLKLTAAHKAADMQTLQFGPLHEQKANSGKIHNVGSFAIHIQCPWHIELAGYKSDITPNELIEKRLATVASVGGSPNIHIGFDSGYTLVICPNPSSMEEQWRFFIPGGEHVVFPLVDAENWSYAPESDIVHTSQAKRNVILQQDIVVSGENVDVSMSGVVVTTESGGLIELGRKLSATESDELRECNRRIETKNDSLWNAPPLERDEIEAEIKRLQTKAARLIQAKADASMEPIEAAHDAAVREARRQPSISIDQVFSSPEWKSVEQHWPLGNKEVAELKKLITSAIGNDNTTVLTKQSNVPLNRCSHGYADNGRVCPNCCAVAREAEQKAKEASKQMRDYKDVVKETK